MSWQLREQAFPPRAPDRCIAIETGEVERNYIRNASQLFDLRHNLLRLTVFGDIARL